MEHNCQWFHDMAGNYGEDDDMDGDFGNEWNDGGDEGDEGDGDDTVWYGSDKGKDGGNSDVNYLLLLSCLLDVDHQLHFLYLAFQVY